MDDQDESLLLRRALGWIVPENYVSWAVDGLCQNKDTPALRILAGLNPSTEREEIEPYFLLACAELGLVDSAFTWSALETVQAVRRGYDRGRIPPSEVVEMLAEVYESWGRQEELLAPWYNMREELNWGDGDFYPPTVLVPLQDAVAREWSLFDRALSLQLSEGWIRLMYCTRCKHAGPRRHKTVRSFRAVWSALRGRGAWSVASCERCGSTDITCLEDPSARSAYLSRPNVAGLR